MLAGSFPVWLSAVRHASRRQYDVFPVVACRRRRQNQLQRHHSIPSHHHLQPERVQVNSDSLIEISVLNFAYKQLRQNVLICVENWGWKRGL